MFQPSQLVNSDSFGISQGRCLIVQEQLRVVTQLHCMYMFDIPILSTLTLIYAV
jgi:hypothetical protein